MGRLTSFLSRENERILQAKADLVLSFDGDVVLGVGS